MDVCEFNGYRLFTGLRLDYRLRLWAPTSTSRAVFEVVELLVFALLSRQCLPKITTMHLNLSLTYVQNPVGLFFLETVYSINVLYNDDTMSCSAAVEAWYLLD